MFIDFNYKFVGVDGIIYSGIVDGYSYLDGTLKSVEQELDSGNKLFGDYEFSITPCNPGNGTQKKDDIRIDSDGWVSFYNNNLW